MEASLSRADLKQLYAAYNLYNNWHQMSGAQKSRAVIALGIQGYKFQSGNDFSKEFLVKPSGVNQGLTYGDAFSLFGSGVNVYSLVKNWDQMNTLQRVTGGATTGMNLAQTAKNFNLLGFGTKGAAARGVSAAKLTEAGWASTPSSGVGAISGPAGTQIPQGYTAIPSGVEGQVTAIPVGNVSTAGGAIRPGTPMASWGTPSYAGYAGAAMEGVNAINTLRGDGTNQQKAYAVEKNVALGAADIYTAGGASAAYALLNSIPVGRKLTGAVDKVLSRIDPVSNAIGMFDTDKWKTEGNRWQALKEQGAAIPDSVMNGGPTRGRSKDELVAIENEKLAKGEYGNPKFAASRNVADLQAKDIWGYAAFAEHDPEWFGKSGAERLKTAQMALDSGAVKEHHGTIDIDWDKIDTNSTPKTDINGADGGSQMQAGLANMAKNNPYVAGAMMAHSAFNSGIQGVGDAAQGFLAIKDHLDPTQLTLANGAKANVATQSDVIAASKSDLHYYAGLAGTTLTEMLAADKHPSINKAGQQLGNAMLGSVGSGEFTPENFAKVRDNFRGTFSKAGISSQADAYRLSNTLYAGGRINDTDLFRMHQVADMTFGDNGFDIASKLFPSKGRGLEVAQQEAGIAPEPKSNVLQFQTKEQMLAKNQARFGVMNASV